MDHTSITEISSEPQETLTPLDAQTTVRKILDAMPSSSLTTEHATNGSTRMSAQLAHQANTDASL